MTPWIQALNATALCLSLLWLVLALARRPRTPLSWAWAAFCASLAMAMGRGLVGADGGLAYTLLGLGACLTCNGFWLVARALFREGRPFGAPHFAYAGLVAVLIVLSRHSDGRPFGPAVDELLVLLGSGVLVLAFLEGLRGWRNWHGTERTLRGIFLATFGGSVVATMVLPSLLGPGAEGAAAAASAAAAALIVLVTQGLVTWRLNHPLGVTPTDPCPTTDDARTPGAARAEDQALAHALEDYVRRERPYLQPELKLSHLAQTLDVSEYRVSQAVREVLGHRNINQFLNAYRLEHARRLLSDPANEHWSTLVVGLESGFGSLGSFHRAFKAAEGRTPGEYRARAGSEGQGATCIQPVG